MPAQFLSWRITRYVVALIFGLAVIAVYHVVEINLFSFDFTRRIKNVLFQLKSAPVNLVIAALLFVLLVGAVGFLMLYVFERGYFLELDELPAVLVVVTVFTVVININDRRASRLNPAS
jgi:hypothetical protein